MKNISRKDAQAESQLPHLILLKLSWFSDCPSPDGSGILLLLSLSNKRCSEQQELAP